MRNCCKYLLILQIQQRLKFLKYCEMNLLSSPVSTTIDVDQYREALGAFKKLNNLIDVSKQNFTQNRKNSLHCSVEEILDHTNTHRGDGTMSIDDQIKEIEYSIRADSLSSLREKSRDQADTLIEEIESLKPLEKNSVIKDVTHHVLNSPLAVRETECFKIRRESKRKSLTQNINSGKDGLDLSFESCEHVTFVPNKDESNHANNQNIQNKLLMKRNMELLDRIRELERANDLLQDRSKFLEEEILNFGTEMNDKKCQLLKEKEKLINKENSLKIREQTLTNREKKLVENTKFINTAIESVNQCMRVNTERKHSCDENVDERSITHLETKEEDPSYSKFVRNLQELKDISNHSHQDYKYQV